MLWVKAFHIAFVISWFAGLLYLPRLFVYHANSEDRVSLDRFEVMEKRLFAITTIGAIGSLGFGIWLLAGYAWSMYSDALWLHLKLALVVALIAFQLYCGKLMRDFRLGRNQRASRFYRMLNEVPALIMLVVVILVVVKPF